MVRTTIITLSAVVMMAGGVAVAQELEKADRHYEQGKAYFRVGEFALCVKEFAASYALVEKSGALFNRARCHEELGQDALALKYFRDYLAIEPNGAQAIEATARSAAIERKLLEEEQAQSTAPQASDPPASAPTEASGVTPSPIGARDRVTAELESAPPPRATNNTKRNLAIGSAAFGAVSLGVATVFALGASSAWSDAKRLCPEGSPCNEPAGVALSEDAESRGNMASIFSGVAVASLVASGYLWFTRPDNRRPTVTIAPTASGNAGSVQFSVSF